MRQRPSKRVWRKTERYYTHIFLYAVNHDCTLATFDWPENNDRMVLIPSDDGWVMPLFRDKIVPSEKKIKASNAGQASESVYAAMAQWAKAIFDHRIHAGYNADDVRTQDPQLMLF